ncbi:MAG: C-GCAxxG-C-C family (seleno)protein [Candidatus Krumholzibacteriia bacterium]
MSELVFVQAFGSRFEAEQAQQYLAGQGIDSMVMADDVGGMYAGLSLGRKGVRLLVRPEDEELAREALRPGVVLDPMVAAAPGAGPDAVPAPLVAAEAAARHFDAGHNCAEAVLRAFAADLGRPEIVRLATGFGGGMGRDGDQCGALSGALLTVGLYLGRDEPGDDRAKDRCYAVVREVRRRFVEACGHADCRDLTGVDLRTEAGRARFEAEGVATTVCRACVREAARVTAEVLARETAAD